VLLIAPSVALLIGFIVVPFIYVIRVSFATQGLFGSIGSGWTLANYRQFFQATYLQILAHSIWFSFENTVICLVVGYIVGYFLAFRAGRATPVFVLLLIVPFWASFLIRMSAWMILLSPHGIVASILHSLHLASASVQLVPSNGAVLIGLLYVFMPSAVLPIYAGLRTVDPSLVEAAKDLGCGPIGTHWRVILPLGRPGIVAAALFVFAPSLGVFVIPVLLGGGKSLIIGNLIVTLYLEFRNMPFGAAVSVVLFVIVMVGIAACLRAMRSTSGSGGGLF
jgi:spermidine/putrescine transport system permease protein